LSTINVRFLGVARLKDRVPVAWHTSVSTRNESAALFEAKFKRLLTSDKLTEYDRLTVVDRDAGTIHFETGRECLFVAICSPEYSQRIAFKLLTEFRASFEEQFEHLARDSREGELQSKFRKLGLYLSERFEHSSNVDELSNVQVQVDEVKSVMERNIEQALKNQESLEILVERTEAMKNEATSFKKSAVVVKNKYWWQNAKLMVIVGVALVLLLGAVAAALFFTRSRWLPAVSAVATRFVLRMT